MPPCLRFAAAFAALFPALAPPAVAEDGAAVGMDAMEVMADLTLIDGACRNVVVNFGAGFRFAATQGVAATAILPGGARRSTFETVLQARRESFAGEDLCGQVASNYLEALPGSVAPAADLAERRP